MKISRQWFWNLHGKHIIAKYRSKYPFLPQATNGIPRTEARAIRQGLIPTFVEFVDYVIDTYPQHDAHWAPLTDQIDFCNINYKLVFRVEKLNDQLSKEFDRLTRQDFEVISGIGGHKTNTSSLSLQDYIDQLSKEQKSGLQRVYELDYQAFSSIYKTPLL